MKPMFTGKSNSLIASLYDYCTAAQQWLEPYVFDAVLAAVTTMLVVAALAFVTFQLLLLVPFVIF
jgi:hypothetical protein